MFVGREQELGRAVAVLDAALTGRGSVVLVGGEPGIGKTRLVRELADVASVRGARVAWGRCPEDGAPPYWPWTQILRALRIDDDALAPLLGASTPVGADLEQVTRFRLLDDAATALLAIGPAVVVVDDAQWADPASLDLLRMLGPRLPQSDVLVAVTYRDVEVVKGHPLSEVLAELVRVDGAARIGLGRLPGDAVSALASAAGLDDDSVAAVVARSEGNPFFAEELVRLIEDGEPTEVPGGVREVIRRRVDRLGPEADDVLTAAAVIGREVEVALLDAVVGRPTEAVLSRAQAAGVLAEDRERFGWWRFPHDLLRETLYDDLGTTARVRLHDRVTSALEGLHGDDPTWYAALAHHAIAAAPAGDADRASRWAEAAAIEASARISHDEAAALFGSALEWFERGPSSTDRLRRCDLLTGLGEVYAKVGRIGRSQRMLLEAAERAGDDGDRLVRALMPIGRGVVAAYTNLRIPVPLLERALGGLDTSRTADRAELLVRLAMNLAADGQHDASREMFERGVEEAEQCGLPQVLLMARATQFAHLPLRERLARLPGLAEEARQVWGDPRRETYLGVGFDFIDAMVRGDLARAGRTGDAARSRGLALGNDTWLAFSSSILMIVALLEGRFDDAEQHLGPSPGLNTFELGARLAIAHERGDPQQHHRELVGWIDAEPLVSRSYGALVALGAAETGDLDGARRWMERAFDDDPQPEGTRFGLGDLALCIGSEVAAILGDVERARMLYDRLRPFAGVPMVGFYSATWCPGAGDLYLGICAATIGDLDLAERHYEVALRFNEAAGTPPYVARTKLWWARLCRARGERERGSTLATEAKAIADELGMRLVAAQAAEVLDQLAAAPARPAELFVGRDPELAELEASLASARAGRGTVALVGGEPGIGKTRLVRELADQATARGVRVAWGRCPEDGAPPYWPWTQILRTLGIDAADLAAVLGVPGAESATEPEARFRLLDAASRALVSTGPALLVIDDAQWADPASLDLLRHLAAMVAEQPVLIAITYRDVEVVRGHRLSEVIAELVRVPRAHRVELRGLDAGSLAELAAAAGLDEVAVRGVIDRSEGNPFFAEELVRLLSAGGAVEVPGGIREVIRRRVDRLGPEADEVLTAAAVIGREVELALLDAVVGGPAEEVLRRGQATGLVSEDPERFGWWRFTHDLFRETLYDDLGTSARVRLHDRVATALEALHPDEAEWAAALAHHALTAGPAGDSERVVRRCAAAAADAAERGGSRDALRWYQLAVEWDDRASASPDPLRRFELLIGLARAQDAVGFGGARDSYLAAAELAAEHRPELLPRALIPIGRGWLAAFGVFRVPIPLIERALDTIDPTQVGERAELLVKLGMNLMTVGRPEDGLAVLNEAVLLAEEADIPNTLLLAKGLRWVNSPRRDRVLQTADVASDVVRLVGSSLALESFFARGVGYFAAMLVGDVDESRRVLATMVEQSDRLGHDPWQGAWRNGLGLVDVLQGRFAAAEEELAALPELEGQAALVQIGLRMSIDRERGDSLAGEWMHELAAQIEPLMAWTGGAMIAVGRARAGEQEQAREWLAKSKTDDLSEFDRGFGWGYGDLALCCIAEAAALLEDADLARRTYEELRPFEGVNPGGFYCALWIPGAGDLYLGMCAATIGDHERAERHYADALAMNERMGARPYVARTKLWWARLRAATGDLARAADLTAEALAIAEELGMVFEPTLLAGLPVGGEVDAPTPATDLFVGRERELAELEASLANARAGRGSVVLVGGEPGIGKTRLVSELADLATARGVRVAWGRCPEDGAPPYWPWVQILRTLGIDGDELAPILGLVDEGIAADAGARFRLLDAASRRLIAAGPALVVVDDAQWADPASLEVLRHLATGLAESSLLVALTYRDVEVAKGHPLSSVIAELVRVPRAARLELRGLAEAALAELAVLGGLDEAAVSSVVARSEGNPFFAEELIRLVGVGGEHEIPGGVREVIRRRVERLGVEADEVLTIAAILGRDVEVAVLESAVGRPVDDVLAQARSVGLVAEDPDRFGWWRFAHDLFRETLHDDVSSTMRVRLHDRVTTALEELHADDPTWLASLAHHALAAGPADSTARAYRWTLAAGADAAARASFQDARRWYSEALSAAPAAEVDPIARCDALLGLGVAEMALGDIAGAGEHLVEAAGLAVGDPDRLVRALGPLGRGWVAEFAQFRVPRELLEHALASIDPAHVGARAELLVKLGLHRIAAGEIRSGQEALAEAVALADASGEPSIRIYAHSMAWVNLDRRDRTSRLPEVRDLVLSICGSEPTEDRWIALGHAAWLAILRGEADTLRRLDVEGLALAQQLRNDPLEGVIRSVDAHLDLVQGRWADAEAAIPALQALGGYAYFFTVGIQVALHRERGQVLAGREVADVVAAQEPNLAPLMGSTVACGLARAGEVDEARRCLAEVLGDRRVADLFWPHAHGDLALCIVAEVAAILGEEALAREVYDELLPFEGLQAGYFTGLQYPGAADLYLGMCASTFGEPVLAERHYAQALEFNERLGARPYIARTKLWWARLLFTTGERARAEVFVTEAFALAEELRMVFEPALLAGLPSLGTTAVAIPGELFVGRDRELAELEASLAGARAGRGSVVLVGGEPGIGKTRLVSELADLARARGVRVAWGRCPEDGAPPYWPWTQILRTLGIAGDELAAVLGVADEAMTSDSTARFRLLDAIGRRLVEAGPAMLIVDDAQWADPASLDVLRHLASVVADGSLLLALTYREVEVVKGHPLSEVIAELVRTPRAARVELRGLDRGSLRELAVSGGLGDAAVDAVVARSGGNPFFAEELIRLVSAGGGTEIPGGVREVIRRRVERLGPDADQVLTAAAALGKDVELALLAAVVDHPEAVLTRAASVGLIAEDPERFGWWRFPHDLFRETLYDDLGTTARVRLHDRIATALEDLHGGDVSWVAALAHHAVSAAPAGDADRAARAAMAAAADAFGRASFGDAVRWSRAALAALDHSGAEPTERVDALTTLGHALTAVGSINRARVALLEAAELAVDDHDRLVRALAPMGRGWVVALAPFRIPVPLLERAVGGIDPARQWERAELLVKLGMNLAADDRGADALAVMDEAVALADASGHANTRMYAHGMRWTHLGRRQRVTTVRAVCDLLDELRGEVSLWETYYEAAFLMFDEILRGALDGETQTVAVIASIARQLGYDPYQGAMLSARGSAAIVQGRFGDVDEHLAALDGLRGFSAFFQRGLAVCRDRERGESRAGDVDLEVMTTMEPLFSMATVAMLSLGAARAGSFDEAARRVADLLRGRPASDALDRHASGDLALCAVAEVAALLGDVDLATGLRPGLLDFEGLQAGFFTGLYFPGAADLYLGMCEATMGLVDEAERHFASALAFNERMGARPYVARTKLWWARLCMAQGERARAEVLTAEALDLAEELGMVFEPTLLEGLPTGGGATGDDLGVGTVTLVFTDIVASTERAATLGDKMWVPALREHNALVRRLVVAHGGREVKSIGDGFMLAFGSARAALECAAALQRELAGGPVQVKVGVHTGEAEREGSDYLGHHVNLASRICGAAGAGEVLLSATTHHITAAAGDLAFGPAGHVEVKGIAEPVEVRRLAWDGPVETAPITAVPSTNLFVRDGDVWALTYDGTTSRVRDTKGMAHLAVLLARPGTEVHALELAGSGRAAGDGGGTGAVLDDAAKAAYRQRLADLEIEVDEASVANDPGRAERAEAERDALIEQLTSAVGLGGRDRTSGSGAERARVAATRTIRTAIDRIEAAHPALGAHLHHTVRTGTFCAYEPDPGLGLRWET